MATQSGRLDDLESKLTPPEPQRVVIVWGGEPDITPTHLAGQPHPGDRVVRLRWPDDDPHPEDVI